MVVAVAAGASFMLSEAIDRYLPVREAEVTVGVGDLLDRAEAGTAGGGSEIGRQTPNSPLEYPQAVFSVLFRPTISTPTHSATGSLPPKPRRSFCCSPSRGNESSRCRPSQFGAHTCCSVSCTSAFSRFRVVVFRQHRRARPTASPGLAVRAGATGTPRCPGDCIDAQVGQSADLSATRRCQPARCDAPANGPAAMTWPDLDPAHLICQVDGVSLVLDRRTGRMARLDAIAQFVIEQRDHFRVSTTLR